MPTSVFANQDMRERIAKWTSMSAAVIPARTDPPASTGSTTSPATAFRE